MKSVTLKKLDLQYALLSTEDHCQLIPRCPNLLFPEVLLPRKYLQENIHVAYKKYFVKWKLVLLCLGLMITQFVYLGKSMA